MQLFGVIWSVIALQIDIIFVVVVVVRYAFAGKNRKKVICFCQLIVWIMWLHSNSKQFPIKCFNVRLAIDYANWLSLPCLAIK